jgi:hypothetical protein
VRATSTCTPSVISWSMSNALFSGRSSTHSTAAARRSGGGVGGTTRHLPPEIVDLPPQVHDHLVLLLAELPERHALPAELDGHLLPLATGAQQPSQRPGEQHQPEEHDRRPRQLRDGREELRHRAMMSVTGGRRTAGTRRPSGTVGGRS